MLVKYDEMARAVYIYLHKAKIVRTDEVGPNVILDYAEDGEVVGVEILGVSAPELRQ